jgi:hypothetical protein
MRQARPPAEFKDPLPLQKARRDSDDEGANFHDFWVPRRGMGDCGENKLRSVY